MLICQKTQAEYPLSEARWKSDAGGLLDIDFQPVFDFDKIAVRPPTMWRYREAIPIPRDFPLISLGEGFTPMRQIEIAGKNVWLKLDYLFPSGSYKDRGASVLMTQARALGVSSVVQDSSGNAGAAVANYAALAGIKCKIFVPEATSPGKLAQIQLYGAELVKVPDSREETARQAMQAAETTYYASHVWNPFFHQGTKTFAYEICEQMDWKAPDTVVLPAGNGTLLIGVYLGFQELKKAGVIQQMPRLVAVQSAQCAPLYQVFHQNLKEIPSLVKGETLAEGISIADPARGLQIVEQVRNSGGTFLTVEEGEIKETLLELAKAGFYVEPTSAAIVAGLKHYLRNQAQKDEVVVSVLTGSGLKATDKLLKLL